MRVTLFFYCRIVYYSLWHNFLKRYQIFNCCTKDTFGFYKGLYTLIRWYHKKQQNHPFFFFWTELCDKTLLFWLDVRRCLMVLTHPVYTSDYCLLTLDSFKDMYWYRVINKQCYTLFCWSNSGVIYALIECHTLWTKLSFTTLVTNMKVNQIDGKWPMFQILIIKK